MINRVLSHYLASASVSCLLSIAAAGVIYFVLVIALQIITYDDCLLLPQGEKIARFLKIH